MPEFNVHFTQTISAVVTVEADNADDAIELAWDDPKMPGPMAYGAFGNASVDESGDWDPVVVTDEDGEQVWTDRDSQV